MTSNRNGKLSKSEEICMQKHLMGLTNSKENKQVGDIHMGWGTQNCKPEEKLGRVQAPLQTVTATRL